MRTTPIAAVIGVVVGATLAGGVAVATSKTPPHLKACATSHGVLTLATHGDRCAKGSHKVTFNKTGPTGARGPGDVSSIVADNTSLTKVSNGARRKIAGTDLTLHTSCTGAGITELDIVGKGDYFIDGSFNFSSFDGLSAGIRYHSAPNSTTVGSFSGATGLLQYEVPTTTSSSTTELLLDPGVGGGIGALNLHALIRDGRVTFIADVFLTVDKTSCSATAQVTPTT